MSHSYVVSMYHCIFSTKGRRPLITPDVAEQLWPYLGGIARKNKIRALAVGGVEDHVHLLVALPSSMDIAKAIQLMKGGSSKWINDTFAKRRAFAWQQGYGAFSIGISQVKATVAYINSQPRHHRKKSFQEEFLAILQRHEIPYDPRYVWG